MSRGFAWLDTGTHESLTDASEFVKNVEKRTSLKIGCLEEISYNFGWINKKFLSKVIKDLKGDYYDYVREIIEE